MKLTQCDRFSAFIKRQITLNLFLFRCSVLSECILKRCFFICVILFLMVKHS